MVNTGQITEISIYMDPVSTGRSIEVGAYLDNAGVPDTQIGSKVERTNLPDNGYQWYDVDVSSANMNVTSGQKIWLAATAGGGSTLIKFNTEGGTNRYTKTTWTYGDGWPDPFAYDTSSSSIYSFKGIVTY
jgi:hypothetical protein